MRRLLLRERSQTVDEGIGLLGVSGERSSERERRRLAQSPLRPEPLLLFGDKALDEQEAVGLLPQDVECGVVGCEGVPA